jgi:hypothetical protein
MRFVLILLSVVGAFASLASPAGAQSRCTREWNSVLRQWDIRCDDGTSGTERYNPVLRQHDIEIERRSRDLLRPLPQQQRCTRRWDTLLRQEVIVCE